jgi:hypothetical protein
MEVIDVVPLNDWGLWESYWISQFKTWGFKLTNMANGGEGGNLGPVVNKIISEKRMGCKHTEKSKEKIRQKALGRVFSEETRKKLSEQRVGEKKGMWGKKQSKKCIESKYKSIIQIDMNDNVVKIWPSFKSVTDTLGINRNNIRMVCNGKRNTAGGFKWKWNE